MTYGSFLYPPQIHLEQEDPLNLDEENDMIEGSLLWFLVCLWTQMLAQFIYMIFKTGYTMTKTIS